jgi:AcrR family transcriptional regulator
MDDSRSALLAAGAEEFAKGGLDGTRIQAIVNRAGVNERMIYYHFGSKVGLYAAVLDAQMSGLGEAWLAAIEKGEALEPYQGMRGILAGFFDILMARPLLVALMAHEALAGWQTLPRPTADMLPRQVREVYERGQREGVFRVDIQFEVGYAVVTGALVAMVGGVPRFAGILESRLASDPGLVGLRDQIISLLMDGLTGQAR